MDVSIIIPALNTRNNLQSLLGKLITQRERYPNTEIIVVDDGSTDDMRFLDELPIKVMHHPKNQGVSSARNNGLRMATGKYITFIDSDDDVVDDYLKTLYDYVGTEYDWVSFRYLWDGKDRRVFDTDEPLMKYMVVWAFMFRRDVVDGYWFDETMNTGEDQKWLREVLKPGQKFIHTDRLTILYRFNGNTYSIIHRVTNRQLAKERKGFDMPHTFKNVFYIRDINAIGGTESFLEYLGKIYGKSHDITVFYRTADPMMLQRIKKYLRVKKFRDGEAIRCEKLFCNINTDIMADVVADERYQIIHADYKVARLTPNTPPDIDHFVGVSQSVCDVFTEMTGKPTELCYNPIELEKPRRALRLISATRLTKDKGAERMSTLASALTSAGIPFVWDVYTDSPNVFNNENIVVHRYKSNILDYVASADYLVQLSDAEGYCYSIVESLCIGIPVIVTDTPTNAEIGVIDGINGWVLPLDMGEIPTADIEQGIKPFHYEPPADRWGEILAKGKGTYQAELKKQKKLICTRRYFDIEFEKEVHMGERLTVTGERAEQLVDAGVCRYDKGS